MGDENAASSKTSESKVVSTDPPYYDNIGYADLSDFFYAWLRRPLVMWYPDIFLSHETNKIQEAITNPAEHPDDRTPDASAASAEACSSDDDSRDRV